MTRGFASAWLIAPFATWMALMTLLPATATAYAVRTVVVAILLLFCFRSHVSQLASSLKGRNVFAGLLCGLAVFVIWILPEQFDCIWYRKFCIIGEGGTEAVAEASVTMIVLRLLGSAFVISVAEELFFRKWLIGFAGFAWMVVLFAVEHDRWLVAAIAGAIYGWLYLRRGLLSAIIAHATTNLVLGLWVLATGQWQFW